MDFVTVASATFDLGWRFTQRLPRDVAEAMRSQRLLTDEMPAFSPARRVTLPAFDIATDVVPLSALLGDPSGLDASVRTIAGVCELLDHALARDALRLATEDELEAACGGELFWWGMTVPDGRPYPGDTSFDLHLKPNARGMRLNQDPYRLEIVRDFFKLGDGGVSICGGEPWPAAWLALSPSFRVRDEDVGEAFVEFLETTFVRPVRRGESSRAIVTPRPGSD